ncbi:MAG: electron transfer flavoprotein subunit alpha/FixB family protein [Saccharospirillaceae bacterium]|nr:FAD-binding protein [Pseudomonadales bacterium]NRB79388.1 electron transfer flavoprotein subunit alpha/FixB family protein [Saccharospirillaceae bacterium]
MSTLVIADVQQGKLDGATAKLISAVQKISGEVHLLVVSFNENALTQAKGLSGLDKIIGVTHVGFEHPTAEIMAPLIVSVASEYSHIVANTSTQGKNLLPRVAALLDTQQVSDVIEIISDDTFKRSFYAGNVIAKVQVSSAKKILTIRATVFNPVAAGSCDDVKILDYEPGESKVSFVSAQISESTRPELTSASIVISGGRGLQNGENFVLLEKVADKLGAAIGASRAAVDAGFVSNDLQVGQTGKIVAPDLYIAVGISGAIQHLAGMKDSKVIVAINKDPDAPIFQVADYGLVADLFDVLPELESKL